MKLEDQVCSLDLAKRLKELGVNQESLFWWEQIKTAGKNEWKDWQVCFVNTSPHYRDGRTISAFTVAELGEMLPKICEYQHRKGQYGVQRVNVGWVYGSSEADARAKMLIYLLENNLLKADSN